MQVLTGNNTYTGGTVICNCATLQLGNGGASGAITGNVNNAGTLIFNRSDIYSFNGSISGAGNVVQTGSGTTVFADNMAYTGTTTVNGGTLSIASGGSIVSDTTVNSGGTFNVNGTAAGVIVNAGGTLSGNGTIGNTVFNGGTLSPGNSIGTITINGNLTLSSAMTYMVEVSPSAADRTNVTGSATLAGTVQAVFAPGSYVTKNYTILHADGGRNGTFSTLTTTGLPAGFKAALNYSANDAVLELKLVLDTSGLNINQNNVATTLKDFFTGGGALPPAFASVFGLTGANLGNALSQLSGEAATGVQQAGFHSMDLFLNAMLDPFVAGRNASVGPALAYGSEPRRSPDVESAFAMFTKAPKKVALDQRLHAWGAAYGGYNSLDGDAIVGSHDVIARTGGFAGGADYRVSPNTVFGAAIAMEGSNWGLGGGIGSGRSEAAKLGIYGSTGWNDAYLSAAVAGGWYRASTSRTVSIGVVDHLESDFDGSTLGARLEGGNRFSMPGFGITPYAALQLESVHTPGFAERSSSSLFGLTYASETATDTRSELGAWVDTRRVLDDGAALLLRARGAWVHNFDPGRHLTPAFETLPGTSFVVNGASAARDAALASAAAELTLRPGLRFIAKFDGQFADGSQVLAGTATLRATW